MAKKRGAIQSFQPIKNGRSTVEHLLLYQYSAYYYFNTAPITFSIQRLCFCPYHYRFCFIIASISTNSLPIFRLR